MNYFMLKINKLWKNTGKSSLFHFFICTFVAGIQQFINIYINMRQKKYILSEQELPTQWYNIQADMPNKPLPPLNPQTHQPMNADDLSHVFNKECSKQELDTEHAWIDIPEDVLEKYTFYRSTPLFVLTDWRRHSVLRRISTSRMRVQPVRFS